MLIIITAILASPTSTKTTTIATINITEKSLSYLENIIIQILTNHYTTPPHSTSNSQDTHPTQHTPQEYQD